MMPHVIEQPVLKVLRKGGAILFLEPRYDISQEVVCRYQEFLVLGFVPCEAR